MLIVMSIRTDECSTKGLSENYCLQQNRSYFLQLQASYRQITSRSRLCRCVDITVYMLSETYIEKMRVIYNVLTKAWLDWPRDCNGNVKQGPSDRTALQVAFRKLFDFMDGVKGIKIRLPQAQHHCECECPYR